MKKILLTLGLFASLNAVADTQFICRFGSEVLLSKPNLENPTPIVNKKTSQYTFMVNKTKTAGSYINLEYGLALPMVVYKTGKTITFIEKNSSDNLLIVTAFIDNESHVVDAVFTQHAWTQSMSGYEVRPYTALGACTRID